MQKGRLEAFSDGVIAIIITIMVLDLKTPHGPNFSDLTPVIPIFFNYILSFIYLAIYWNNHHHLLQSVTHVTGRILWANIHLLFWLSLVPFATGWSGQTHFSAAPVALYGIILFMAAISYTILTRSLIAHHGRNSILAKAVGRDLKGNMSLVAYAMAIPLAFILPGASLTIYALVAVVWTIPDARIEALLSENDHH